MLHTMLVWKPRKKSEHFYFRKKRIIGRAPVCGIVRVSLLNMFLNVINNNDKNNNNIIGTHPRVARGLLLLLISVPPGQCASPCIVVMHCVLYTTPYIVIRYCTMHIIYEPVYCLLFILYCIRARILIFFILYYVQACIFLWCIVQNIRARILLLFIVYYIRARTQLWRVVY
jgi:hypothetical protein